VRARAPPPPMRLSRAAAIAARALRPARSHRSALAPLWLPALPRRHSANRPIAPPRCPAPVDRKVPSDVGELLFSGATHVGGMKISRALRPQGSDPSVLGDIDTSTQPIHMRRATPPCLLRPARLRLASLHDACSLVAFAAHATLLCVWFPQEPSLALVQHLRRPPSAPPPGAQHTYGAAARFHSGCARTSCSYDRGFALL
jgi:hypothetical protein